MRVRTDENVQSVVSRTGIVGKTFGGGTSTTGTKENSTVVGGGKVIVGKAMTGIKAGAQRRAALGDISNAGPSKVIVTPLLLFPSHEKDVGVRLPKEVCWL